MMVLFGSITAGNALVISAVVSPMMTAFLVWINQKNATRAERHTEEIKAEAAKIAAAAAEKAEEVRRALIATNVTVEQNLAHIAAVGNNTHVLVNSQMGRALLLAATTLRALAKLTGDSAIQVAAINAEAELKDHRAKQATLDAKLSQQS